MMSIPDKRIHLANPQMGEEEIARVVAVMESGQLADGPEVRAFEREFADFCGAKHGVAVSNGTTALHAAFVGLGLGEGSRVVTSPFSFIASANGIRLAGADVGFVDIDPATYNMDPHALEAQLRAGEQIDGVLAVHLYGLPADMAHLAELRDEYGFVLVEDAAQAHGATVNGRRVGSLGDAACFSFYPTKNMTTGEGGMILTDDADIAERAARYINHGRIGVYEHSEVGHNFRLTSIGAAIGRAQLEKLPGFTQTRQDNAALLTERLADTSLVTPFVPADRTHVYHQYTVRTPDRDGLKAHLDTRGIDSGVYYPKSIHQQPAYADVTFHAPEAEAAAAEVLSLPVHPTLSEEDLTRIVAAVTEFSEGSL
ncbi:DegT/DnrJ/EryC1/StrS family aminotransferase [Haladaptatus sp. GCM10025707]|uniref:DegT/DnrJ/EryC1/StrS family aminotransferase n=1 Tax=unclassified Haladaptatus TaxID=2622732 RepID=UPI0034E94A31